MLFLLSVAHHSRFRCYGQMFPRCTVTLPPFFLLCRHNTSHGTVAHKNCPHFPFSSLILSFLAFFRTAVPQKHYTNIPSNYQIFSTTSSRKNFQTKLQLLFQVRLQVFFKSFPISSLSCSILFTNPQKCHHKGRPRKDQMMRWTWNHTNMQKNFFVYRLVSSGSRFRTTS